MPALLAARTPVLSIAVRSPSGNCTTSIAFPTQPFSRMLASISAAPFTDRWLNRISEESNGGLSRNGTSGGVHQ